MLTLLVIGQVYAWIGLAVALVFVSVGVGRIDPNARGAWPFRLLLIPGAILIWPLVLWRWRLLETGRVDDLARHRAPRRLQSIVSLLLIIGIPVFLIGGLSLAQNGPWERPAERLEDAE